MDYCWRIKDVLGRARSMRNMAGQSANRLESINIFDGRFTQFGKETLRELYRVHFPGCVGEEVNLQ
jgi:hypothetical protein